MNELKIYNGDTVKLESKNKKNTICIALAVQDPRDLQDDSIKMNKVVRKNLKVRFGESIFVTP